MTNFCESLDWHLIVLILKQFRERLFFGIHPDLIDLMKIPSMTSTKIARALYKSKIRNLNDLANAKKVQVEDILISITDSNGLFMSGKPFEISVHEVAKMLISEARNFIQNELGMANVKWGESQASEGQKTQKDPINSLENSKVLNHLKHVKNESMTTKTNFKTPLQKVKIVASPVENLQNTPQSSSGNFRRNSSATRKRKEISHPVAESPEMFDSPPKKLKTSTTPSSVEYKRKLRSSGSKTDLPLVPTSNNADSDPEVPDIENFSYENVSLFNNPGISLDDEELLPAQTTSDVEKYLNVIDVESETDLKSFLQSISQKSEVAVSVGVSVIHSVASTIGGNILRTQKSSEKYIFKDKFYISCISFCCEGNNVFHLNLQRGNLQEILKTIFSKQDITFCMFECKENLKVLRDTKILEDFTTLKSKDPKIAAWFIDPDMKFNWSEIMDKFGSKHSEIFNLIPQHHKSSVSIGLDFRFSVSTRDRTAIEAYLVKELLKAQKMNGAPLSTQACRKSGEMIHLKAFVQLEMPIQKILAKMEIVGFPVDVKKLHNMIEGCVVLKRNLEEHIYRLNGGRFDITNKSVVAKVVGIHKENGKKMSTAKEVLSKIDSPIANSISTFRTLSTTISNLQPLTKIVRNGRVHGSSFSLTQTGRISMFDPNLQNVTKDFVVEYQGMNN